jgi:hypothetical protein
MIEHEKKSRGTEAWRRGARGRKGAGRGGGARGGCRRGGGDAVGGDPPHVRDAGAHRARNDLVGELHQLAASACEKKDLHEQYTNTQY